jgi:hypothetical protein
MVRAARARRAGGRSADDPPVDDGSQQAARDWLLGRGFAQVPARLFKPLGFELAGFVGFLMDWERKHADRAKGGWFYVTVATVQREVPSAGRGPQVRLFGELERRRLLFRRGGKGRGCKRWVKINYRGLRRLARGFVWDRMAEKWVRPGAKDEKRTRNRVST